MACLTRLAPAAPGTVCKVQPFGSARVVRPLRTTLVQARPTHTVEVVHQGKTHVLNVPDGESILSVALDQGLELPHDCKLGVCMTCPAKLVSGTVDQSGCILSDDVIDKGYCLLCVAQPTSSVKIATISEDELLDLQLCSGV